VRPSTSWIDFVVTTRPARRTVTLSAISNSSPRRCDTYRHARARALDLAHEVEQPLDLLVWQQCRRLVEHEHALAALPPLQRTDDRHDRALHGRGLCQWAVDVELDAEALEQAVGLLFLLAPADASGGAADEAAAERQVVHRVELVHEAEVLMDEAQGLRHVVADRERLAAELGVGARVGVVVAARVLIRVDLPEPFWPISAWTSPGATSSDASISARVPGKVLDRPVIRSAGSPVGPCGGSSVDAVWDVIAEVLRARPDRGRAADLFEVPGRVLAALGPQDLHVELADAPDAVTAAQLVVVASHDLVDRVGARSKSWWLVW
jgi:hypothetical protein